MKNENTILSLTVLLLFLLNLSACGSAGREKEGQQNSEHETRGPHGGKLLKDGAFSVELNIFDTGVPPVYRIYAYENDNQLGNDSYSLDLKLSRLGGHESKFSFSPIGDYLQSNEVVEEPHSFQVEITANYQGQLHHWKFDTFEGRTTLDRRTATASGVRTEKAIPAEIRTLINLNGKIEYSEHRIAHIIPRFSGIVREGRKHIGDKVLKGEVLAIIESNTSLQPFEVKSQISGTVIEGHLVVGEYIAENQWVFVIADLGEVWADFFVPLSRLGQMKLDQQIQLSTLDGSHATTSLISYIAPYIEEQTQSQLIRAVLDNKDEIFMPGAFVQGSVVADTRQVPVSIKKSAVQSYRDWQVVFKKVGDIYEVQPLILGVENGERIEVVEGLRAGEEYVSENAFLIKADILKTGATHDH